jgi:hypothetical protein
VLEPKRDKIEINCVPATRGISPEELAGLLADGWLLLDIMPIRREITCQEKLTIPQIPPNATHIAEPMIVFYRVVSDPPPPLGKIIGPGVN